MAKSVVNAIFDSFGLTNEECLELESKFGKLCYKIVWELKRKNSKNNYTEDLDDVMQELRISMVKAGCYYKRQTYLEECMKICSEYIKDEFLLLVLNVLRDLWSIRTHHGAHRTCFGEYQESLLGMLVLTLDENIRPKKRKLEVDSDFGTYCKAILWNCQKNLGRKISKMRNIRNNCVSISEFDYMGSL